MFSLPLGCEGFVEGSYGFRQGPARSSLKESFKSKEDVYLPSFDDNDDQHQQYCEEYQGSLDRFHRKGRVEGSAQCRVHRDVVGKSVKAELGLVLGLLKI